VNSASWGNTKSTVRAVHQEPATDQLKSVSPDRSFVQAYYDEVTTQSDQLRTLGIVRTSDTTAWYVDIFRSRQRNGQDKTHDYIYHNAGRTFEFTDMAKQTIPMTATDLLQDADSEKPMGYSLLKNQKTSGLFEKDFQVHFQFQAAEAELHYPKVPQVDGSWGEHYSTRLWQAGAANRELFRVDGVPTGEQNAIRELPNESMVVFRQHGSAWDTPFISVIEPYKSSEASSIKHITRLSGVPESGPLVALDVESQNRRDVIFDSCDSQVAFENEGFSFRGIYGVASETESGIDLYLGCGYQIAFGAYGIESHLNQKVSACLKQLHENEYSLVAEQPVCLQLPIQSGQEIRMLDGDNADSNKAYMVAERWGKYTELWETAEIVSQTSGAGTQLVKILVPKGMWKIKIDAPIAH
jgi:hypothetical protein